jgi:hypothetical protein
MKTDELKKLADVADRTASTGSYWNEREDFRIANDTSPVPPRCAGGEQMNKKQAQEIVEKTDKEAVKRLSRIMNWYGNHWRAGDSFSEQRAEDCGKVADTLLTLLAALDAAEAEKRAAVAAAYEKAADRAWKDSGPTLSKAIHALSDTDALAEYVERVRADERERCAKIADKITRELRDGGDIYSSQDTEAVAAAIRQETNDG